MGVRGRDVGGGGGGGQSYLGDGLSHIISLFCAERVSEKKKKI